MVDAVLAASALLIAVALDMPLGSLPPALVREHVPAGAIASIVGAGPLAAPRLERPQRRSCRPVR